MDIFFENSFMDFFADTILISIIVKVIGEKLKD